MNKKNYMKSNAITTSQNQNITIAENLSDYYKKFINYLDTTEKTISSYERNLKVFSKWLDLKGITQPTREDIITFRNELKETHKPTTTRAYINTVKQFFKWLAFEGLYSNISENIKSAKVDHEHKKDFLSVNQVKELLGSFTRDTIQSKRDYAIILLCILCGLRTIEVVRANIEDLRTCGGTMVLYVQGKGKDDKTDYVKVPYELEKALRVYLQARGEEEPTAPLFSSLSTKYYDTRLTTRSVSRLIKQALRKIGLNSEFLTAHSLRHTTANLNLRNGGTLEETQQLLRHANISTTMIYIKEMERADNPSEERLQNLIFGN